jgi:hypothetical protein
MTGARSALAFCANETPKKEYKDKSLFFYNEDIQLLF